MKILIIEDEKPTAIDLQKTLLEINPKFELVGLIDTVESAISYFKSNPPPDLVFMDIQLADGMSFEIFEEVEIKSPIIFCTAFDEYAIDAFKVNGIDYLLKPFDRHNVEQAINKMETLKTIFLNGETQGLSELIHNMQRNYKTSFLISYRDKMIPILTNEIAYFCIEHELTFLYTFEHKRFMLPYTLEELERSLDPNKFFRANRQFLVNIDSISEVEHYFARKLLLKMNSETKHQIIISKAKASSFINWMQNR